MNGYEILEMKKEAGDELARRAKEIQLEKGCRWKEAFDRVRREDPELYQRYLGRVTD